MEREQIRDIKSNFGGMDAHKSFMFLKALDVYIEHAVKKLITEKYTAIKAKHIRVITKSDETIHAHFIDNTFRINFYNNEQEYQKYRTPINIRFGLNELFGNCSTVVLNNMELVNVYSNSEKLPEYYQLALDVALDLADLFGYTCVTYSTSSDNTSNLKLEPILAQSFAIVDQYQNKRGGLIKIFNKII